jgi:hypothetical protein
MESDAIARQNQRAAMAIISLNQLQIRVDSS